MKRNSGYVKLYDITSLSKYKKGMTINNVTVFKETKQNKNRKFFNAITLIQDGKHIDNNWIEVKFNIE